MDEAGTFLPGRPGGEEAYEATEMGAGPWGNPLLLLAALALVARLGQLQQWSGLQESTSPKNVNSTLAFFMEAYNNNSNDSYLFRVDQLLRSQVQVRAGAQGLVGTGVSPRGDQGAPSREQGCSDPEPPEHRGYSHLNGNVPELFSCSPKGRIAFIQKFARRTANEDGPVSFITPLVWQNISVLCRFPSAIVFPCPGL